MKKAILHEPEHNQGVKKSYVLGFVLSLVFTAIPYYLVVNKSVAGFSLLIIIIAIAVLQMLVQLFFFLHLGRGPKPLYNVVFFGVTAVTIMIVVGGSLVIMNNLHYMAPSEVSKKLVEKEGIHQISGEKTGACQGVHTNHRINIKDDQVSPVHIKAKYCDTLTFINEDNQAREMTFGSHPAHGSYGGESKIPVKKSRNKTITLNQTGTFRFHDHFNANVAGSFTVIQ